MKPILFSAISIVSFGTLGHGAPRRRFFMYSRPFDTVWSRRGSRSIPIQGHAQELISLSPPPSRHRIFGLSPSVAPPNAAQHIGTAFKLHLLMAGTLAQLQFVRPTPASGLLVGISGFCFVVKGHTLTAKGNSDSRCGATCNSPIQRSFHEPFDIPRSGGGGANGD
jgi:hypothetical protein